jgi:steroid 5-alpha reductase family enzyme
MIKGMQDLVHLYGWLVLFMFLYMSAWFLAGDWLRRDDLVDSAWGIGFVFVALITMWHENNYNWYKLLSLLLVTVWGLRLSWHLTSRNSRKKEDWRYKQMRIRWKKMRVLQTYVKIYLFQGLLILVISAPVVGVLVSDKQPIAGLMTAGFIIWSCGIVYEAVADYQLSQFKTGKGEKSQAVYDGGLWRYSRHPNYFGEIVLWLGAAIVALGVQRWWAVVGPIVLAYTLLMVSGEPLLRKKYKGNKAYQKYIKRTSMIVPLPPKKSS